MSFSYIKNEHFLKNINLKIKKHQKVAFVGPSGAGKSTLVDIISGLLVPDSGQIFLDKKVTESLNCLLVRSDTYNKTLIFLIQALEKI